MSLIKPPIIPELYVVDRFVKNILNGSKTQLIIIGKRTNLPDIGQEIVFTRRLRLSSEYIKFAKAVCSSNEFAYFNIGDIQPIIEIGNLNKVFIGIKNCEHIAIQEGFENWGAFRRFYLNRRCKPSFARLFYGYIIKWNSIEIIE